MTVDESQKLQVGSGVRDGWRKGVVTQLAPTWIMIAWTHDIPQIIKRDPVSLQNLRQVDFGA